MNQKDLSIIYQRLITFAKRFPHVYAIYRGTHEDKTPSFYFVHKRDFNPELRQAMESFHYSLKAAFPNSKFYIMQYQHVAPEDIKNFKNLETRLWSRDK